MTHPDDFTLEYRKHPGGSITDFRITRGKDLYHLPWWRRVLTPWRWWRFRKPSAPFPTTTDTP
jgi:hypothetical protein